MIKVDELTDISSETNPTAIDHMVFSFAFLHLVMPFLPFFNHTVLVVRVKSTAHSDYLHSICSLSLGLASGGGANVEDSRRGLVAARRVGRGGPLGQLAPPTPHRWLTSARPARLLRARLGHSRIRMHCSSRIPLILMHTVITNY